MKDLERIRIALAKVAFPSWVADTKAEIFEDASGETAARVWLVIRTDQDAVLERGAELSRASRLVHEAFEESDIPLWPYVNFRSAAEAA